MKRNTYKRSRVRRKTRIKRRIVVVAGTGGGILLLLGVSCLFIFGYDFLTQCTYFATREVAIEGNRRLSDREILRQAQITIGVNALSVSLPLARKRLLAHTWIAEAELRRDLPSRIWIRVEEHRPLAVLDLGRKLIINTHGEIFKELSAGDPETLPTVSGLSYSDINVEGQPRSRPFSAVMSILRMGLDAQAVLPNREIHRIQVDREIGLSVIAFGEEKKIILGYDRYSQKYRQLKHVLQYLGKKKPFIDFASIDLNNIERIVVDPVRGTPPGKQSKEV